MSLISVTNVVKKFGEQNALSGINLVLNSGEQVALKGASGSGKSTLLYLLAGMDRPTSGEIAVDGQRIDLWGDEALSDYRNAYVGLVFQFHFLLPAMNCLENIMLPAHISKKNKTLKMEKIKTTVLELAEFLGVKQCLAKYPYQLSGGEQQRINILRALVLRPKLLLCDEPTGNLDSANGKKVTTLLKQLALEFGATLVLVTHDDSVAMQFERIITIKDGHII